LLWLRHALDAEHDTRDRPRSLVTYDALLDDWAATAETIRRDLGLGDWPRAPHQAAEEIEAFLSTSHRHHRADRDALRAHPQIPSWVAQAYDALTALSRGDGPASRDRLDAIRAELAVAEDAFGPLLADRHRHRGHAEDRQHAAEQQAATLDPRRDSLEAELASEQGRSAAASRRIAELEAVLAAEQEQSAATARRIVELEAALTAEQGRSAAASRRVAVLEAAQEADEQQAALLRRLVYETQQAIRRDLAILDRIDAVERRGMVLEAKSDQVLASLRKNEAKPIPATGRPGRRWWRHWPGSSSAVAHHLNPPIRRILDTLRGASASKPGGRS
jgi:hypothetical protein